MNGGHTVDETSRNGRGETELQSREGRVRRPDSAAGDDTASEREAQRPAAQQPEVAGAPHRDEHAPTPRTGGFARFIRERLWYISLVAVASVGLATGFVLGAPPQYWTPVLVLVGGPLLAGVVFGVGVTFLEEYVVRGRRSGGRPQRRPNPPSTVQESADKESSES